MYFDYTPTHARDGPERILQGFKGYLQADALPGYHGLYAKPYRWTYTGRMAA